MDICLLDDITDPDVEARLYGEIYYSNDTYPDQPECLDNTSPLGQTSLTVSNPGGSSQGTIDSQSTQSKSPGLSSSQTAPLDTSQCIKRKKHRALIDGLPKFPHSPRTPRSFLIDKGLSRSPRARDSPQRIRKDQPKDNPRRREYNPSQKPRRSRQLPREENPMQEDLAEEQGQRDSTSLTALDEAMADPQGTTPKALEAQPDSEEAPNEASKASVDPPPNNAEPTTSKYNVSGNKLQKKKTRATADVSDSDDSILEVPVPPKPIPLLISLPDSDDESSSEEESPVVMDKSDKIIPVTKDSSSESSRSSSPVIIEDSETSTDSPGVLPVTHLPDNLIMNCTTPQKGASTLAEIKRVRESDGKTVAQAVVQEIDEESMTESEAMNWGSLEGEMESSQGETLRELWQEFSGEGGQGTHISDESGPLNKSGEDASVSSEKNPEDKSTKDTGLEGAAEALKDQEGKRQNSGKRPRDRGSDVERPRKRKRQKENREVDIRFEEYLLQPMPKQLRDFYNEPRGGDMMRDIKDIQNEMPKNPNRWMILDSDMYPLPRKKRNVCSICQNEGHLRSRCPNGPRAVICHICGIVGHSEPRCPENKKCISCGAKYSTCRTSCEQCVHLRCSQCSGRGHSRANCPDNWRKYHQTTSGASVNIPTDPISVQKPPTQLSCCNCTRRGHDASTCTNYRWSNHFSQSCYVRNYNVGPSYASPSSAQSQPLPDLREPINIDRLGISRSGPSTYLFHFVNTVTDTSSWKECSIVPNQLPDVDYPARHDNPVHPVFLRTHFGSCRCAPMEVFVNRSYELQGLPVITLRAPDEGSLQKLQVLVHQWLARPKDDKVSLSSMMPLPEAREKLFQALSLHFTKFRKRKVSGQFWREMVAVRRLQESINVMKKERRAGESLKLRRKIGTLRELKYACVVATYKYILIDTPRDALNRFYDFFRCVEELPEGDVSGETYLTAVWYYFELFSPHLSPTILNSLEMWRKDPTLHVRGEMFYRNYIQNIQKEIDNGRRKKLPDKAAQEVMDPGPSSGGNESTLSSRGKESRLPSGDKDYGSSSGVTEEQVEGQTVNQGDNSQEKDIEVIDVTGDSAPKASSNLTLLDVWKRMRATKEGIKMSNKVAEIMGLGLPVDMPIPNDPRVFTPELLAKYTNKAFDVMRRQKMRKVVSRVMKLLDKTGGSVVDKEQLIACWQMIRDEMVRRRAKKKRQEKKCKMKNKKVICLS
ncbi:uncharacterized protein LOC135168323 isoform X2 [Diachasmimorpha longicaudata]